MHSRMIRLPLSTVTRTDAQREDAFDDGFGASRRALPAQWCGV
jgi:hypothetical protein